MIDKCYKSGLLLVGPPKGCLLFAVACYLHGKHISVSMIKYVLSRTMTNRTSGKALAHATVFFIRCTIPPPPPPLPPTPCPTPALQADPGFTPWFTVFTPRAFSLAFVLYPPPLDPLSLAFALWPPTYRPLTLAFAPWPSPTDPSL